MNGLTQALHVRLVGLVPHAAQIDEGHMLRLLHRRLDISWLLGGPTPLKNMKVKWDDELPNSHGKVINVPNHQPVGISLELDPAHTQKHRQKEPLV